MWQLFNGSQDLMLREGVVQSSEVDRRQAKGIPVEVPSTHRRIRHNRGEMVVDELLLLLMSNNPSLSIPQALNEVFSPS